MYIIKRKSDGKFRTSVKQYWYHDESRWKIELNNARVFSTIAAAKNAISATYQDSNLFEIIEVEISIK